MELTVQHRHRQARGNQLATEPDMVQDIHWHELERRCWCWFVRRYSGRGAFLMRFDGASGDAAEVVHEPSFDVETGSGSESSSTPPLSPSSSTTTTTMRFGVDENQPCIPRASIVEWPGGGEGITLEASRRQDPRHLRSLGDRQEGRCGTVLRR